MSAAGVTVRGMSQPPTLCFIDTETTSLRPDRRAWEIALVLRRPGEPDQDRHWFVAADDLELDNADLASLRIGRFFDRHPDYCCPPYPHVYDEEYFAEGEKAVLREVEELTRGAHLVGAVPSFDAEVLAARMRAHGLCPSWHYHLQDFETLIVGYLAGQGQPVPPLPWRSDDLSRLIGIEPPSAEWRHTALGDAQWGARVWDAVMGIPS